MAQIIGLPKLSPTMEEGVLVRWTKKEGDKVSPGDLVAEVETDKANMDFNIEDEGVLLRLLVKEGDTVKLGAPVAIIGKAGEDVSGLVAAAANQPAGGPAASPPPTSLPPASPPPTSLPPSSPPAASRAVRPSAATTTPAPAKPVSAAQPAASGSRLLASPLAKSLAIELGIDLRKLQGSGPGGRIVERDVRAAVDGAPSNGHAVDGNDDAGRRGDDEAADQAMTQAIAVRPARQLVPTSDDDYDDIPASNMRKRIAARLTEAKRDVPHFYLMRQLDAAGLVAYRERLNDLLGARAGRPQDRGAGGIKISVNDLVIKAVALALRRMPECNAAWEGDAIRRFHHVHLGVAVAIDDGLVTPVIRDADRKGIGAIAAEVRDLAERAKQRQLKGHEITGSTFTISNLGMHGIERFTAILNPPEAGILAIGAVMDVPVVVPTPTGAQVVPGKRMTVTMSCDHRVIDGALGARWLQVLAELIEKPESLAL